MPDHERARVDIAPFVTDAIDSTCLQAHSLGHHRIPATVLSLQLARPGVNPRTAPSSYISDTRSIASGVKSLLETATIPVAIQPAATLLAVGGVKVHVVDLSDAGTAQPQAAPRAARGHSAGTGGPQSCPVSGMSRPQAMAMIMAKVDADPSKDRTFFAHHTPVLGVERMWALAEQAEAMYGSELTADGALRTKAGIFMKLALKFKKELRSTGTAPPTTPMPPQQAASLFTPTPLASPQRLPALPPPGPSQQGPLYPYQKRVLDRIAPRRGQNWLVVAPTGTGKTRIFVEHFKIMKLAEASSRAVVVVPTVALTAQHSAAFRAAGFPANQVGEFHSEQPLHGYNWQQTAAMHSVVIATAQSFLNVLNTRPHAFSEISLLVLDEAHHTNKDHPYMKIMDIYHTQQQQPQVVAFTASPGAGTTLEKTEAAVTELATTLRAELEVVDGELDATVQQVAPSPKEHEVWAHLREQDVRLAASLWAFAQDTAARLEDKFCGLLGSDDFDSLVDPAQANQDMYNQAGALTNSLTRIIGICTNRQEWDLMLCSQLVKIVVRASELVQEIGFEPVFDYLGRKLYQLLVGLRLNRLAPDSCTGTDAVSPQEQGTLEHPSPQVPEPTTKRARQPGSQFASTSRHRDPELQPYLDAVANSPVFCLPKNLQTPELDAYALQLLTGTAAGEPVLINQAHGTYASPVEVFPKLKVLNSFLKEHYSSQAEFHGIVFVQSRTGVYLLAEQLRQDPQLGFLEEVLVFTGHGVRKSKVKHGMEGLVDVADTIRGLSGTQQKAVLNAFKVPGRRLLVATSAAEEGIDVQACELVARYSSAATGIQRVQSRGRGRKAGGKYLTIVLDNTLDMRLHAKSRREEEMMRTYLRGLGAESVARE